MNMCRYFLCFAVFSFIGWLYESLYYTIQQKKRINSGFLSTCFCPIYGIGALLDLILLGRIENPLLLFFAGMLVTGVLEYFVSWLLEELFHQRWWDYTNWPLNINGRVCIFGAIAFGILTVALIKVIAPFTMGLISSMGIVPLYVMTAAVAFVMLTDTIVSVRNIDSDKLWYVEKQTELFADTNEERRNEFVKKLKNTLRK